MNYFFRIKQRIKIVVNIQNGQQTMYLKNLPRPKMVVITPEDGGRGESINFVCCRVILVKIFHPPKKFN